MSDLTHIDCHGKAAMVDITHKPPTRRTAEARCEVVTTVSLLDAGNHFEASLLFERARVAGIQAAKLTASLIPLCHPLWIDGIELAFVPHPGGTTIRGFAEVTGRTGVEMEALTGCGVAALTLLSELFAVDPDARMTGLCVWQKSGGLSGPWSRLDTGLGAVT